MSAASGASGPPHSAANEALIALYRSHYGNLLRLILVRVGDPEEAVKVAHGMLFNLMPCPPVDLSCRYLFDTAANLTMSALGRHNTFDVNRLVFFFDSQESLPAPRHESTLIWPKLRDLPPSCALAIHLVDESGYEIAKQEMNLEPAQIRKRVARATEHLQDFLSWQKSVREERPVTPRLKAPRLPIQSREEAASWQVALQAADVNQEQVEGWLQWMAKPAHQQAFDEATELLLLLRHTGKYPWPDQAEAAADPYNGSRSIAQWQTSFAAKLATGGSLHRVARLAPSIAALLTALVLFFWLVSREPTSFATDLAEHKHVALRDGTTIELGGKSAITRSTVAGVRSVALEHGEAFFKIERNAPRPPTVIAGNATITSAGAEFNVRRRDGRQITLTVVDGAVEIDFNHSATYRLRSGQQLTCDANGRCGDIVHSTDDSASAWRDGLLVYESEPLKFVAADLNRYSARRIEIGDRAAGEALLNGVVYEWDIDNWLPLLPQAFPGLDVIVDEHRVLIRTRQPSPE